ncbi:hypothetical protein GGD83_001160 [Rhodoblastus sphagnicola]|uniref:hypothetical protein n=1 Tax=Rhodoblastus sphagnicola TaxID=333368 RepID=UPI000CECCA64|nr:hypothetical protein [Rhodoblastus sphagnicola]MBB4197374.1 hypothetical protein [Rhodoblastus sphagnicola]
MEPDKLLECAIINLYYARAELRGAPGRASILRARNHIKEALSDLSSLDLGGRVARSTRKEEAFPEADHVYEAQRLK